MGLRKRVCSQLLKNHDTLSGIFFIKEHITWYLYQILGSIYLKGTMKVHLNTEDIYVNEKCYFKNLLDYWDYFSSWGIMWIPENFVGNRWLTAQFASYKKEPEVTWFLQFRGPVTPVWLSLELSYIMY